VPYTVESCDAIVAGCHHAKSNCLAHLAGMNILVATPGRLLQHMDETPGFDCSNVAVVVLDEADRCMDMGFAATMDAIVQNLPAQRQTMLFSATQSKRCVCACGLRFSRRSGWSHQETYLLCNRCTVCACNCIAAVLASPRMTCLHGLHSAYLFIPYGC
jgi:DEAD/DEAH box helicase